MVCIIVAVGAGFLLGVLVVVLVFVFAAARSMP